MSEVVPDEVFYTLDQLVRRRAETHADDIVLSYQNHGSSFVDFTGWDIELLTRIAAINYYKKLPSNITSPGKNGKVALVGVSGLAYYFTFIAIQRLGLSAVFISPRLADQGFAHLLKCTACSAAIVSEAMWTTIDGVIKAHDLPITMLSMLDTDSLPIAAAMEPESFAYLPEVRDDCQQLFVIHSGGTTGLPKPVPLLPALWLDQARALSERMAKVDTLSTLPLFHSFGLATLLRCLYNGKRLAILDAARPVTAPIVTAALDASGSQSLVTVPYILKFFSEMQGGLERLAAVKQVIAAGSAIPDDLGDRLVNAGISIFHLYGLTETGALMEPSRDQWNWVTPLPKAEPFLKFEPFHDNLYHLVVLPGLKAKVYSDQPDGSYATKDLFQPHSSDPRKWRFVARKDDIIVLVNGEKADPTPLEDAMLQNPGVKAAIVFGAQRQSLGMIVIKADHADDRDFLDSIEPNLQLGNSRLPAYAKVDRQSIIIKPADTPFARTDKATMIRMQVLKQFAQDIEDFYAQQERPRPNQTLLTSESVRDLVRDTVQHVLELNSTDFTDSSDFFDLGMDSLQANHVRSNLVRKLGVSLATNVVFDHPTVELLVDHLLSSSEARPEKEIAGELVEKYSYFEGANVGQAVARGTRVLLTGATGTIGVHVLHHLLKNEDVDIVYCLVRAPTHQAAHERVITALGKARLLDTLSEERHLLKIQAQPCNFSEEKLGLSEAFIAQTRSYVTHIIHNAWSVNFNHSLRSFEQQCIRSTHYLLELAGQSFLTTKPIFTFISSIAVALRHPSPVPETLVPWSSVGSLGYGQSKWVGEQVCAAAEKCGVPVRVARVGQVAGDTTYGAWNPSEAIPTTVQTALTIGALPYIEDGDERLSWLPVDVAANTIARLAMSGSADVGGFRLFHVVNKQTLLWNREFLPFCRRHGLHFNALPQSKWLQRLEESPQDVQLNPPVKLLQHFRRKYGRLGSGASDPVFDVSEAAKYVSAMGIGTHIDEDLVGKFLKYWLQEAWPSSSRDSGVDVQVSTAGQTSKAAL